jgi:hypothetical protein
MTNKVYRTNRHVFVVFCAQLERVYLLHYKLNVLVEFSKDVNLYYLFCRIIVSAKSRF